MFRKSCIFLKQILFVLMMAMVALLVLVNVPLVSAEEKTAENNGWEFKIAPYMWFLTASGDVTVKGQESDLDLSFNDIWDELNIAAMVAFEGRKGRWGFYGEIIGANLGKSTKVGGIKIDPTVKLMWLTAGAFYRLGTWNLLFLLVLPSNLMEI